MTTSRATRAGLSQTFSLQKGKFSRQEAEPARPFAETEDARAETPPLLLAALRDPRLRVKKPLAVTFHQEKGKTIAVARPSGEYGAGDNKSEALQELQHALGELYHSLQEDQHRLGPGLEQTWQRLQEHIRPYPEEETNAFPA